MSYTVAKTHQRSLGEEFQTVGIPVQPSSKQKKHHLWSRKAGSALRATCGEFRIAPIKIQPKTQKTLKKVPCSNKTENLAGLRGYLQ